MKTDPASPEFSQWSPDQYLPMVTDSGAEKLSMSRVAPLVAAGRGYKTISGDPRPFCEEAGLDLRAKTGLQIKKILTASPDVMVMPWYLPADVSYASQHGTAPNVASRQLRPNPAHLLIDENGRANKYVMLLNNRNVLGVHPSTPYSWLASPQSFFIAEGMLKADSALSALLAHLGATDAELASQDPATLTQFMESVPPEGRMLIVAIVGVTAWQQNPEWDSFDFREKDVAVAFDGDITANVNVWRQAKKIERKISSKRGLPRFLVLPDPTGAKLGVDDFFALGKSWTDLTACLEDELPDRPDGDGQFEPGEWSIDEQACETLEWVASPDGPVYSRVVYGFSGRWVSSLTRRSATKDEMETGVLDEKQWILNPTTVEIEVKWKEADGVEQRGLITGSSDMLSEPPERWTKSKGAKVSANISGYPTWPPKPKWAEAVKSHMRESVDQRAVWDHMGWVPTKSGQPVFIVGNQVFGDTGELTDNADRPADPGVDEEVLHGAGKFGVHMPEGPEEVLDAIEEMLDAYEVAWTDPRYTALAIAVAMRPVAPLPFRSPIFISGTQGSGKSWTASAIMGFWQAYPGAWRLDELPGGVADTMYATENAVSRVPIWVSDDLAPSASKQQAEAAEAKLSDIIRAVFNGSAKRRMFADGTSRQVLSPRAVFIATAENPLSVTSVMSRVVHIRTSAGFLENIDPVNHLLSKKDTLPTITAFVILQAATAVCKYGWKDENSHWKDEFQAAEKRAHEVFETNGHAKRHTKIAADIGIGLTVLENAVEDLRPEFPVRAAAILDRLAPMKDHVYSLVGESYQDQLQLSPGRNLLRALSTVLRSGQAHLITPGEGTVPILDTDVCGVPAKVANQLLGWQLPADAKFEARPGGTAIGSIVRPHGGGEPYALFDPQSAFDIAKRFNPGLIPPGMGPSSSWNSMWDDMLASGPWARKKNGKGGRLQATVLTRANGANLIGVPVPLSRLLGESVGGSDNSGDDSPDDGWDHDPDDTDTDTSADTDTGS
jgi:hypothetical protein